MISRAVKVTAAAVTHGQITVSVSAATNEVSQPQAGTLVGGEAGETTPVTNAELSIQGRSETYVRVSTWRESKGHR